MESSYAACTETVFGRMSFKGANPEIERLMRKLEHKPSPEELAMEAEKDAEISAADAAFTLNHQISRKFAKTRHRGFKRPAEEMLE